MTSVVRLPVPYCRPRTVRGAEIWDQPEPSPEMVWEVCVYTRPPKDGAQRRCMQCPRFDEDLRRHGCYDLAAEACRIVFAMQKREAK